MNSYFKALLEATLDGKRFELQHYWRLHHTEASMMDTDLLQRVDKADILNTMQLPNANR